MRLTTDHADRPGNAGRASAGVPGRSDIRGRVPVAAFSAAVLVLGLAAAASPASASPAASGGATTALRKAVSRVTAGSAAAASHAQPVAVAVVEQSDGSLTVETHETGSVASAALVADRLGQRSDVVASGVDHTVQALVAPADDVLYGCQWALQSTNSSCSDWLPAGTITLAPRTLKASSSWPRSTGTGVKVAVVDSGVRAAHLDLAGGVIPGVDLVNSSQNGTFDAYGHGTHVAGIVAARDNDKGGLGLAPGATILPVRVLNSAGQGTDSNVASGIIWAVDHGADVINLSLGGKYASPVQQAAVNYALSKGVLVVASAGNSNNDPYDPNPTLYPAAFPGVLAVGSTGFGGAVSIFSERKAYVGIAAPGEDIASTCFDTSATADDLCWDVTAGDPNYAWLNGTSMAAPFVSAAAALLLEENPNLSPAALGAYLTGTATPAGAAGRDTSYGFGHLNPNLALDRVISGSAQPTSLSIAPSASRVKANASVRLTSAFASNGWRLARRPVQFQQYAGGVWRTLATVNTNGSGVASYTLAVGRHTRFRAVAVAAPGLAAAVSANTIVAVTAKVAIKGYSPSADKVTVKATVWPHQAARAKLQRKVDGVWRTISTKTTTSAGTVTFKKRAPSGKRKFRVVVSATSISGQGVSSTLTIRVK